MSKKKVQEGERLIERTRIETIAHSSRNVLRDFNPLGNSFFSNPGLKLLALVLSLGIWLYVGRAEEETLNFMQTVYLDNVDQNYVLMGHSPETVRVLIRGSASSLRRISAEQLVRPVRKDVGHLRREGQSMITLSPEDVNAWDDPFITVEDISPSRVSVELERKIRRTLPVLPRTRGTLPFGYDLGEVTAEGGEVTIMGPASIIADFNVVYTRSVPLNGKTQSFRINTELQSPDDGAVTFVSSPFAMVSVEVIEVMDTKILEDIPIVAGAYQSIDRETCAITLKGPLRLLQHLDASQIQAVMPEVETTSTRMNLPIGVAGLPEGVTFTARPKEVRVVFTPTPTPLPVTPSPEMTAPPATGTPWAEPVQRDQ